jgi:hypothetical protein
MRSPKHHENPSERHRWRQTAEFFNEIRRKRTFIKAHFTLTFRTDGRIALHGAATRRASP